MRYKSDKNIKFVITRFVFFQAQNAPKSVTPLGELMTPLDPLVGWEGGYPLPIPLPARRLRHLELGAGSQAASTQNPG